MLVPRQAPSERPVLALTTSSQALPLVTSRYTQLRPPLPCKALRNPRPTHTQAPVGPHCRGGGSLSSIELSNPGRRAGLSGPLLGPQHCPSQSRLCIRSPIIASLLSISYVSGTMLRASRAYSHRLWSCHLQLTEKETEAQTCPRPPSCSGPGLRCEPACPVPAISHLSLRPRCQLNDGR